MPCPHCAATATSEQPRRTARGYRTCRYRACRRVCNERTGTAYNHWPYPTDRVLLVVLWRRRDKLRRRDLAALFLERGFVFSHEAARDGATRCAPLLADRLRAKRRGQGGTKWHADETDVRVHGAWCSRYRALDRDGNRVEALLSKKRAMAAARRCFVRARDTAGQVPAHVTTDGHDAYPRAIRETLGESVHHRNQPRQEQAERARSSRPAAALLPHARVRFVRLGRPLLLGLRGAASVLPRPSTAGRDRLAGGPPSPLPGSLGCGHGRADRRLLSAGAGLAPPCALPSSKRRPNPDTTGQGQVAQEAGGA